jgi:hypothetical protein
MGCLSYEQSFYDRYDNIDPLITIIYIPTEEHCEFSQHSPKGPGFEANEVKLE